MTTYTITDNRADVRPDDLETDGFSIIGCDHCGGFYVADLLDPEGRGHACGEAVPA